MEHLNKRRNQKKTKRKEGWFALLLTYTLLTPLVDEVLMSKRQSRRVDVRLKTG